MGRPMRPDGRIAAAVAALGQNMLEGRRRRHPLVSTANLSCRERTKQLKPQLELYMY